MIVILINDDSYFNNNNNTFDTLLIKFLLVLGVDMKPYFI